jgi:acetolactate synthase I/II/III large subunit
VVEKPPFIMRDNGVKVIHVDFGSAEVDPVYFPQVEVVGDIAPPSPRSSRPSSPGRTGTSRTSRPIREAAREHFEGARESDAFPMRPGATGRRRARACPADGIVTLDNGMYKIWFARNYPAYGQNTLLLDNALATMGAGLPSAMAARIVHPDRRSWRSAGTGAS